MRLVEVVMEEIRLVDEVTLALVEDVDLDIDGCVVRDVYSVVF